MRKYKNVAGEITFDKGCSVRTVLLNNGNFEWSGGTNFLDCNFNQNKVKESNEA